MLKFFRKKIILHTPLGRWGAIVRNTSEDNSILRENSIDFNSNWANHDHCGSEACKIMNNEKEKTKNEKTEYIKEGETGSQGNQLLKIIVRGNMCAAICERRDVRGDMCAAMCARRYVSGEMCAAICARQCARQCVRRDVCGNMCAAICAERCVRLAKIKESK